MLHFRNHAKRRMRERGIKEEEVEYCLNNHDISHTDKKGNPIYVAFIKGRRIKVVVEKENPTVVITVADKQI